MIISFIFPSRNNFGRRLTIICFLLVWVGKGGLLSLPAQTNDAKASPVITTADREQATLAKHIKPILAELNLTNAVQLTKVQILLAAHLRELDTWHEQNDAQIKSLWTDFNQARAKQNQTNADAVLTKIDAVYASLQPQHGRFIYDLSTLLTTDQIEMVKDVLTINKVKITFHAYGEIFPGLTDEQKAFILKNLKAAREEAIDAGSMPEKSAFFKRYKIKIEAYLTAQGYDVKQSYKVFVAKQKAELTTEKSGTASLENGQP